MKEKTFKDIKKLVGTKLSNPGTRHLSATISAATFRKLMEMTKSISKHKKTRSYVVEECINNMYEKVFLNQK